MNDRQKQILLCALDSWFEDGMYCRSLEFKRPANIGEDELQEIKRALMNRNNTDVPMFLDAERERNRK